MANNENLIPIPGRLHSVATEGHVAGADEIYDDTQSKLQSAINADVAEDISDLQEIVGEGSVDTRIENAVKALDAEKSQTAGTDGLALSVTEVDGKITSISGSIATDTYDSYGSASAAQEAAATDATTKVNAAKAELLGDAATDYNTLGKLEDAIQSEASTRETEIGTDSTSGTVKGRIKSLETLVGSTDVDSQIDAKINALDSTKSQTAGTDGLALSIEEEDGKIKSISGSIAANTYDAYGAASTAKSDLLGDAASDYNTLGKLEDAIQAEATTRSGETEALDGRLDDIEEVIPSAATSSNQLADKSFVNSSISTATAEYQGSYNSVSDLELTTSATHAQIATALGTEISGADNNDYCFVQIPTADATPTDIAKVERYKYNGTAWSFEYELNNSGYTDAQWAAINSGITSDLVTAFGNKYDKPSTGIPSTDMTSDVQTSLDKADSAYQKPSGGIPDSDLTSDVQTSLDKADTAYQKPSGGIPASDLADGVIPDISGKANKSEMSVVDGTGADVDKTTITLKDGTSATVLKSHQDISGKQDVIDSTHKLAADLVDDTNSTNKFTNATEKQTWNAKQDALTFNTTPSADNKVATMADIEDATENCAYLGEDDGSAVIADFDPQTDTVWKKAQTLSNAEKSQVKTNLGLPQEIYSKTEVNGLITTPNQQYVTVATYASLPATGSADTVYRVSNYNGSTNQVDATMYSEYAWNGSDYTFLCVKSQVGEVFDITAYNSNTKYADLAAALGTNGANIPESLRKGGMSVKYVSNSDNKYIRYNLLADAFTTDVTQWQKVTDTGINIKIGEISTEIHGRTVTNRLGALGETGNWIYVQDNYTHALISCEGGCKVNITANSSNKCNFAFLTSDDAPVNGEPMPLCVGTSRMSVAISTTKTFIAPMDCKYIAVLLSYGYSIETYRPLSLLINGKDGFSEIVDCIDTNIKNIKDNNNNFKLLFGRSVLKRLGSLGETGNWIYVQDNYTHSLISVMPGDVINITANQYNACKIAFLTNSSLPVTNNPMPLCEGTSRINIDANATKSFVAPKDAKYIAILLSYGNPAEAYKPSSLLINGKDGFITESISVPKLPKCVVKYSSSEDKFEIYMKDNEVENLYYMLPLNHIIDNSELGYANLWRIAGTGGIFVYDGEYFNSLDLGLLTSAENEFAFKFQGKQDFTGGYHGDERIDISPSSFVKFFADGCEVVTQQTDFTINCNEFYLLQSSTLHDTTEDGTTAITNHPIIGKHIKKTVFKNQGYEVYNKVIFDFSNIAESSRAINTWFSGLCCINNRCAQYSYGENFVINTSLNNNQQFNCGKVGGVVEFFSNDYKIRCRVNSKTLTEDNNDCSVVIWDRVNDEKYYRYAPVRTVTDGYVFESIMNVFWDKSV